MLHRKRKLTGAAERPIPARIGVRALLLIFAFWTVFGVATAANELVSPFRPRPFREDLVALTFVGAYLWAAVTPLGIWFVGRFSLEQGSRPRRVVLYLLFAGLLALLVSSILALVGSVMVDPAPANPAPDAPGLPPLQRSFRRALLALIRYRFLTDLMAALLVIAAGLVFDYFRRFQARQAEAILLREQLVESRLQVLRNQLNPHFLFNTLNAVAGLVSSDPQGVRRMIARLSDVLRYSLDGAQQQVVRLEREFDVLRRYLEILEIRYQGRLVTTVTADPEALDALVPALILQPLAENAMTHGVSRAGGRGRIDVHARVAGAELFLTVQDTGAGPDGDATSPQQGLAGIGLRHIRQRLEQLYGAAYRLELRPLPEYGAVAEVVIPFRTAKPPAPVHGAPHHV